MSVTASFERHDSRGYRTLDVAAVRAWFVAYLTWAFELRDNQLNVPPPAIISGLASLAGFAAAIVIAECALRWGQQAIVLTCMASVFLLLVLAGTTGGSSTVAVPLLVLAQNASLADASALASGAVAAADPRRRGAALAVFAFVGYSAAFIGPGCSRHRPRRVRRRRQRERCLRHYGPRLDRGRLAYAYHAKTAVSAVDSTRFGQPGLTSFTPG